MAISIDVLQDILERALTEFFRLEAAALVGDVNERNSCGRLAIYLQRLADEAGLAGYYADTEYNRNQGKVKTILDKNLKVITINCDLILHSRGANVGEDNLIAVEMKKFRRHWSEKMEDRDRLRALTKSSYDDIWSNDGITLPEHVCGYRLGVYIELNSTKRIASLEYYMKGERIGTAIKSY